MSKPLTVADLFALLPDIEGVWLVSMAKPSLSLDNGDTDELGSGNYILLKVTRSLVNESGLFQVPAPRRKESEDK